MQKAGIRERLLEIFEERTIGLQTVILVSETIIAHAKFNIWFGDNAKGRLNEEQLLDLLDKADVFESCCIKGIDNFKKTHELSKLHDALSDFKNGMQLISKFE